jgi:hypothetical protein
MADTKISALTAVAAAALANEYAVNEAGTSKKVTGTQLQALLQAANGLPIVKALSSPYTNSTTTGTIVTGLNFAGLVAGTYHVRWILLMQSAATTTSPKFGVNYTGTVTRMSAIAQFPSAGVTAATGTLIDVANATTGQVWAYAITRTESTTAPNLGPWVGVTNANQDHLIVIEAVVVVSDSGDLELWAGSEVAASQIQLSAGSCGILTRVA